MVSDDLTCSTQEVPHVPLYEPYPAEQTQSDYTMAFRTLAFCRFALDELVIGRGYEVRVSYPATVRLALTVTST